MPSSAGGWTRREWVQVTTMAAAGYGIGLRAAGSRTIGVQLYTVRDQLPAKAAETLKAIAAIGFREVEVVRADWTRIVGLAKAEGLAPVSMHIEAPFVTGNWAPYGKPEVPAFEKLLADVKAAGISYAVVAYLLPPERGKDAAAYRTFADQLNRAGEIAKRAGVTLGYHNHAFEFAPLGDGQRGFDVLASQLDPALVTLEMDVFWVAMAGEDPASLIKKLGKRVGLLHLKDRAKGVATVTDEAKVAREAFAEVGSGTLDFRAILAAGDAAGVRHVFVEQDQTPGDPLASIEKSYKYLRTLA